MNDAPQALVRIIARLPAERWAEYKALQIRALQSAPKAFAQRLEVVEGYGDEVWLGRLRDVAEGKSWLVFAERDAALVGMVGAELDHNPEHERAWIFGMFVDEDAQGQGIGSALLAAVLAELAAAGIETARLGVNPEQTAAVRLYEKAGFKTVAYDTLLLGDGKEYVEPIMERPTS